MPDSLVTVATFPTAVEANLAKGCLESAGIPAFLKDEQMVGMVWHWAMALGGVKLQVGEDDAEEALDILALAVEPER